MKSCSNSCAPNIIEHMTTPKGPKFDQSTELTFLMFVFNLVLM